MQFNQFRSVMGQGWHRHFFPGKEYVINVLDTLVEFLVPGIFGHPVTRLN